MNEPAAKLCIGLTGRMAAGKGEAVRILEELGFRYISLSDIVRREAAPRSQEAVPSGHAVSFPPSAPGETVSRAAMQDIGNRLRAEGGAGVLGRRVREAVEAGTEARWVIDGIRNPAEVRELRRIRGFLLIGIACSVPTILERMRKRGRASDRVAEEELRAALEREWGRGEPADGQQVGPTLALADFTVANDGTLAEFRSRLGAVLKEIGVENA
jgi:dephospho-CoA kinase